MILSDICHDVPLLPACGLADTHLAEDAVDFARLGAAVASRHLSWDFLGVPGRV